jgi:hypothetical protein
MPFRDARHNDLQIIQHKIEYLRKIIDKRGLSAIGVNLSDEAYDNAAEIYKLLTPKTVIGYNKIRLGSQNDGGYVFLDAFPQSGMKFAYSFGISSYDPFSLDMVARGYDVWQYDGTISEAPHIHPLIHFNRFNISGDENPRQNERNLRQIIEENGHRDATAIILQCDIEGWEWPMIETARTEDLMKFTQISLELHGIQPMGDTWRRITRLLRKLNETHQFIHVHANNNGGGTILKNFRFLPCLFEVSCVRRESYQFTECVEEFPTKFDSPCMSNLPDIFIGNFNPAQISDSNEDLRNDQLARMLALVCAPQKNILLESRSTVIEEEFQKLRQQEDIIRELLIERCGFVSPQNAQFLYRSYFIAIKNAINVLFGSKLTPAEKIQHIKDVFAYETTKELFRQDCVADYESGEGLRVPVLNWLLAQKECRKPEGVKAVIEVVKTMYADSPKLLNQENMSFIILKMPEMVVYLLKKDYDLVLDRLHKWNKNHDGDDPMLTELEIAVYRALNKPDDEIFTLLMNIRKKHPRSSKELNINTQIGELLTKYPLLKNVSAKLASIFPRAVCSIMQENFPQALEQFLSATQNKKIPGDDVEAYLSLSQNLSVAAEHADAYVHFKKI